MLHGCYCQLLFVFWVVLSLFSLSKTDNHFHHYVGPEPGSTALPTTTSTSPAQLSHTNNSSGQGLLDGLLNNTPSATTTGIIPLNTSANSNSLPANNFIISHNLSQSSKYCFVSQVYFVIVSYLFCNTVFQKWQYHNQWDHFFSNFGGCYF